MILFYIILYYTILYHIILYYIILHYITFCLVVYFYSTQQSYLYLSSLLFCSSVPTLISRIFLNKIQADFDYEPHISLMKIFESAAYIQENVVSYLFLFCSSLLHFSTLFYSSFASPPLPHLSLVTSSHSAVIPSASTQPKKLQSNSIPQPNM